MRLTAKTARLPAETFAALETYRRAAGLRSVNEVIALAVERLLSEDGLGHHGVKARDRR